MKKTKRRLLIGLCVFLALVLVALVFITVYAKHMLGKINRQDTQQQPLSPSQIQQLETEEDAPDPTFTGVTLDPTDVTWATEPPQIQVETDNIINIMLIGQDRRPNQGRQRSDAMILCTINKAQKKLTMTSLQRDMYVQIPGYADNRINAAYVFGGMELFEATLLKNFGITVDGIVEVDFGGFTAIVDMLGGVTITLTEKEARYIGLKPGTQVLSGEDALAYARIRKIDSDFSRTNRQRTILTSLLNQSRGMSLTRMHALLDTFLPLITTNMTDAQIVQYALELFPLLKDLTIESGSIPSRDNYVSAYISGRYVLIPDLEEARQRLKAIMGEDS